MSKTLAINGLSTLPYPPGERADTWPAGRLVEIMRAGGVTAANVTLAVDETFEQATENVRRVLRFYDGVTDGARIIRSVADLEEARDEGSVGLILGFQNSVMIGDCVDRLEHFHALGIRVIQLTYQRRNLVASGGGEAADRGLTPFGKRLIARMNELGVLVDLSHTGRRSSLESIAASSRPVVFSHANAAALAPLPRNKSDEEIRALAGCGGVIGITAIARFLAPETGRATLEDLLDHVDHVAALVGVDHVGIGLDITEDMTREVFEIEKRPLLEAYPELARALSFGDYYAAPVTSMSSFGAIADGLARRGYGSDDVAKVLGGNFARVLAAVWADHRAAQPPSTTTVDPVR